MKYLAVAYAQALTESIMEADSSSARETVAENFYEFLKRNGDGAKINDIIKVAERLIRQKNGETKVLLESADELAKTEKERIKKSFSGKIILEEKIDENLKAGARITINDEILIDASAGRELANFLNR